MCLEARKGNMMKRITDSEVIVFKTTEVIWQESCEHIFNVACHEIENRSQGSEQSRSSLWLFICIVNRMNLKSVRRWCSTCPGVPWRLSNNDQVKDPPNLWMRSAPYPGLRGPLSASTPLCLRPTRYQRLWFTMSSPPGRRDSFKPQSSSWLWWVSGHSD